MKHFKIVVIVCFFCLGISFAQQQKATDNTRLEIPQIKPGEKVINHFAYSLSYNELYEQANWVAYTLTAQETYRIVKRNDKFKEDSKVKTGSANSQDYAKSGYDRGHLAPAADMGWSSIAMSESFYYSNMSPQVPSCNRGVWKRCEEAVRRWALTYDSIYLVTGPVLREGLPEIGKNKVAVPTLYYKVILRYNKDKKTGKGIGFIVPNIGTKDPLKNFVLSIDKVEQITGIDFFPLLPDEIEQAIERNEHVDDWKWD